MNSKYKPGKLFFEGFNYNDLCENVESTDEEEMTDKEEPLDKEEPTDKEKSVGLLDIPPLEVDE